PRSMRTTTSGRRPRPPRARRGSSDGLRRHLRFAAGPCLRRIDARGSPPVRERRRRGRVPVNANDTAAIAAVVVTHESAATIDDCLSRLRAARGVSQVRVVDNDSRDDALAIVQRHAAADPRVRFIANPDNPGFGVACNQGARDGDAPWLAFVNPDCLPEPDALARLRTHAGAIAGDALLGADLVDQAGVRDGAARRNDPDFGAMLGGPFRARTGRPLAVPADDAQPLPRGAAVAG